MSDEDTKTILKYFNLLITQATASDDTTMLVEVVDQIRELIKLHLEMLEEDL